MAEASSTLGRTLLDDCKQDNNQAGSPPTYTAVALNFKSNAANLDRNPLIPTVFRWKYG